MTKKQLWTRWTLANALSEMIGLGLTFAITGLFFSSLGEQNTTASILLSFTVAVLSGAVEATFVGLAQWWAMHPWFPSIREICLVAWDVDRRADRLRVGISALHVDEHGRSDRLKRPGRGTCTMDRSPAGSGDGRSRRRSLVLCPVAGNAWKSERRGELDPCQYAGVAVRYAGDLLGN